MGKSEVPSRLGVRWAPSNLKVKLIILIEANKMRVLEPNQGHTELAVPYLMR